MCNVYDISGIKNCTDAAGEMLGNFGEIVCCLLREQNVDIPYLEKKVPSQACVCFYHHAHTAHSQQIPPTMQSSSFFVARAAVWLKNACKRH